jgi:NAD(P)-dependent dehydrogenase (short-subunit alcohol dehydrogenase family)
VIDDPKRAVLVVGGSGGLGSAVCREAALRGFIPIIGYRSNFEKADALANELNGLVAAVDLARPADTLATLPAVLGERRLGGIVLAGAQAPRLETLAKLDTEKLRERLEADLFGTVELLRWAVATCFKPRRRGCVVGVLSEAMGTEVRAGLSGVAGYVVAKYAMAGVLAALGADNPWLSVAVVRPGFLSTAMLDAFDPRFAEQLRAAGRVQAPESVAAHIVDALAAA